MAHAQICPLCGGRGKISKSLSEIQEESHRLDRPMSDIENTRSCHGCHGRGWIEVADTSPSQGPWKIKWGKHEINIG